MRKKAKRPEEQRGQSNGAEDNADGVFERQGECSTMEESGGTDDSRLHPNCDVPFSTSEESEPVLLPEEESSMSLQNQQDTNLVSGSDEMIANAYANNSFPDATHSLEETNPGAFAQTSNDINQTGISNSFPASPSSEDRLYYNPLETRLNFIPTQVNVPSTPRREHQPAPIPSSEFTEMIDSFNIRLHDMLTINIPSSPANVTSLDAIAVSDFPSSPPFSPGPTAEDILTPLPWDLMPPQFSEEVMIDSFNIRLHHMLTINIPSPPREYATDSDAIALNDLPSPPPFSHGPTAEELLNSPQENLMPPQFSETEMIDSFNIRLHDMLTINIPTPPHENATDSDATALNDLPSSHPFSPSPTAEDLVISHPWNLMSPQFPETELIDPFNTGLDAIQTITINIHNPHRDYITGLDTIGYNDLPRSSPISPDPFNQTATDILSPLPWDLPFPQFPEDDPCLSPLTIDPAYLQSDVIFPNPSEDLIGNVRDTEDPLLWELPSPQFPEDPCSSPLTIDPTFLQIDPMFPNPNEDAIWNVQDTDDSLSWDLPSPQFPENDPCLSPLTTDPTLLQIDSNQSVDHVQDDDDLLLWDLPSPQFHPLEQIFVEPDVTFSVEEVPQDMESSESDESSEN